MNTTVCPDDQEVNTGASGSITLDLSTEPLGGSTTIFLDTLHTDYAFIISTGPIEKSALIPLEELFAGADVDFGIYPNPAREEVFLRLPDDAPRDILLHDLTGRYVHEWKGLSGPMLRLPLGELATGVYCVRVSTGTTHKTKKLLVQ